MSAVLIHRATAGVSRVWLQNISAARKCHPKAQTGILPLYPVPVYEREKQAEKLHKLNSGWKSFHLIKYQAITIQGLGRWGRPSLFAMSTQGVRHMDLVLGVRTVSGSSLEMHESTSRGLDVEPLLQFSTARIWTPSDFSPPIHNMNHEPTANVLHWSVIEYDVSLYYTTKKMCYFTSLKLCIGNIDEPIHHLAHLLNLRSRNAHWVPWVVISFKGKEFIADALLLHSGSFSLCPTDTKTQRLITAKRMRNNCDSFSNKQSAHLLVEYRVRMLNLCWLLNM